MRQPSWKIRGGRRSTRGKRGGFNSERYLTAGGRRSTRCKRGGFNRDLDGMGT